MVSRCHSWVAAEVGLTGSFSSLILIPQHGPAPPAASLPGLLFWGSSLATQENLRGVPGPPSLTWPHCRPPQNSLDDPPCTSGDPPAPVPSVLSLPGL